LPFTFVPCCRFDELCMSRTTKQSERLIAGCESAPSPSPDSKGLHHRALATGVGTDTQRPFALVIVSGLFTRLLISIFLMPVLYALVARPADRLEV
jgi:hypothetical protein